jgi:hypothetical protein
VSISLHAVGYQFSDVESDNWDTLNWLVVAGEVSTPEGSWAFWDPCMLTTEAARLAAWFHEVANGAIEPSAPDAAGDIWPDLDFVEPNIAFGVEMREAGRVMLSGPANSARRVGAGDR